jgi:hypothetical protein
MPVSDLVRIVQNLEARVEFLERDNARLRRRVNGLLARVARRRRYVRI